MTAFLLTLPWLGVLLFVRFVVRLPSALPAAGPGTEETTPFVSVIVPARNERVNIEACLSSLTRSEYPSFEIVVVDDRSEDDTARIAASVPAGHAKRVVVLEGEPLPAGWLGKPWACHQGAAVAQGELLLFTDADTTHGPALLGRAVAGLREERADLLTVMGRQLMLTFWERLVQPQIFLLMLFRFPDFERTAKNGRWRDAIANGQFMLFPRAAYEAIGGHAAVRDEVVEDLALAQLVKRSGLALRIRSATDGFATRMYRSLGEIVAGWSKNIVMGGLQSLPRVIRPVIAPISLATGLALWIAPPALLVASLLGVDAPGSPAAWLVVWVLSVATFAWFTRAMGAPAAYGLLYPLGALVGAYIFARSWLRGRTVEWKGRRYTVPAPSERD